MTDDRDPATKGRVERGAIRVLQALSMPRDRPRYGLMQHEFYGAFSSDGWTMGDFRAATHYAYDAGWIDLDGQLYRLTDQGRKKNANVSSIEGFQR